MNLGSPVHGFTSDYITIIITFKSLLDVRVVILWPFWLRLYKYVTFWYVVNISPSI